MLYGVASSRDAAGADRFASRFGVRGAGGLLPASSAARGGADVGAPCHPSRDRVILLSILTYTFCVRLCVPDTRARRPRRSKRCCGACSSRGVRGHARTRTPGTAIAAGSDCRLGFARVAGVPAVRGRGRARFDSRRGFAPAALGRGKAGVRARGGDVTKARTTISSYRNIDASAAGSGEPRVRRAYHDDDLVAREVGSRSRV